MLGRIGEIGHMECSNQRHAQDSYHINEKKKIIRIVDEVDLDLLSPIVRRQIKLILQSTCEAPRLQAGSLLMKNTDSKRENGPLTVRAAGKDL